MCVRELIRITQHINPLTALIRPLSGAAGVTGIVVAENSFSADTACVSLAVASHSRRRAIVQESNLCGMGLLQSAGGGDSLDRRSSHGLIQRDR